MNMNLNEYPRSKRFVEDSAFLDESKLAEVQTELSGRHNLLPQEKGKLTKASNANDGDGFYSEIEKILERQEALSSLHTPIDMPSAYVSQDEAPAKLRDANPRKTNTSQMEPSQNDSGPIQSMTKSEVGPLFGRNESAQRQRKETNSNLTFFATFIVMLLFAWKLFVMEEDIYVIITLSVSLSMLVPLFIAEVLKKSGSEDILLFISSMGWIGIALASQIGLEWENHSVVSEVFFASELETVLVPILLAFSVFCMPASWNNAKSTKLLQNPWSIPVFSAVAINALCIFVPLMNVENLGNITVTLVSYGAVLSLLHGRRSRLVAIVVLLLIFRPILLSEQEAVSSLFLPLIFIPLVVWFVTYAALDYRLKQHRTLIVLCAVILHGILNLMQSSSADEFIIQFIIWLGFALLAEAHYRNNSPAEHIVLKILDPTTKDISDKVVLERIVAVIGSPASGKSCYLGGLWTLLRDPISRELWYGSAKYIDDERDLPFAVEDIKKLLDSTESDGINPFETDEKTLLKAYLAHRSADFTMKIERDTGVLPETSTPFPFEVTARPQTRRFLDEYMSRLGNDDLEQRKNLVPTILVNTDLEIKLEFCAEVESKQSMLFGLFTSSKRKNQKVKTSFRTLDLPGEDYRATLDRLDGIEVTSNSMEEMLARIDSWDDDGKEAVQYIVKLIGTSHDVLLLIDSDSFTSKKSTARNEVNAFIRLSDQIASLEGANTGHISCLLNKADILIHRGDTKNRMMKNGSLADWGELMDREHALETLIENIGEAQYHQLRNIDVDAYYTCTLGGLIAGGQGEYDGIPPYPMVPINVFEPLLRCLLPRD